MGDLLVSKINRSCKKKSQEIMKKITLTLITLFSALALHATTWIVDNNQGADTDFKTVKEAHDTSMVADHDTLFLVPSATTYDASFGNSGVTRPLTFRGIGYKHLENELTSHTYQNGEISKLSIAVKADSVSLLSLQVGVTFLSRDNAFAGDAVRHFRMKNCLSNGISFTSGNDTDFYFEGCIINGINFRSSSRLTNIIFQNCSINKFSTGSGQFFRSFNLVFDHCIVFGQSPITSIAASNPFRYSNCILPRINSVNTSASTPLSLTPIYNFCVFADENVRVRGGNNVKGALPVNVFVQTDEQFIYSNESALVLSVNSPAKGAGFDGVDAGIFGGDFPYVISGVKNMPLVTEVLNETVVNSIGGINVRVKAVAR